MPLSLREKRKVPSLLFALTVFLVPNLQGVGFFDSSGKLLDVSDLDNRPADLTYFTFRSVVTAADIDDRAPHTLLSLEFSPTTDKDISITTTDTMLITTHNNLLVYIANTSAVITSFFLFARSKTL